MVISVIVIIGKTASGKTKTTEMLVKEHGFNQIITYTTRPIRKDEKQDITYHFISDEDFKQKINDGFFAEYKSYDTEFGKWYYGSALEDLEKADDKSVIILTPSGYRDVKIKLPNKNITAIYIYANIATIETRLIKRGDNEKEARRRLDHDNEDFKGIENEVDRIVYNNDGEEIENVINKILQIVR